MNNKIHTPWKRSVSRGTWREENDKSMLSAFWNGWTHFCIFIVYGLLAIFFYLLGSKTTSYAIFGPVLFVNLIWFIFKGAPRVWKWFNGLVES